MRIDNSFDIDATPDEVFEFLQDAHNVAACFPGAELTEDLGDDSYKGKVKIKVGPVTAAYAGTATIVERDDANRVAVLLAEGKDAKGSGSAKATARMQVDPHDAGATVTFSTDLTISGKLAQFGRGIMADVSGRMVAELAAQVRARITAAQAPVADTPTTPSAAGPVGGPSAPPAAAPPMKFSSILRAMLAGFVRRMRGRLRDRRARNTR